MTEITVVGGGLAGLTAAISCAEQGLRATVHEAHGTLGGRARSTPAPYIAGDGTHAFYDGAPWRWLAARNLVRPYARLGAGELARGRFRRGGRLRFVPPAGLVAMAAAGLDAARPLLGDVSPHWESGRAVLLDIGLRARRGDRFCVFDLDEGGFVERFSSQDPSLAPSGHSLLQGAMPLRDGESKAAGLSRLEHLTDLAFPAWRERLTWRRAQTAHQRSGALDLPGLTWRDRPAIDQGDGRLLAGDMVAAPGLLAEVSINSALSAARRAARAATGART